MAETNTAAKKAAPKKPAAKKVAAKKAAGRKVAAKKAPAKAKVDKVKADKTVRVTLVKSVIGTRASHRATVIGLGLRRIRHCVQLEDTPAVRGMINKVRYLVKVEA